MRSNDDSPLAAISRGVRPDFELVAEPGASDTVAASIHVYSPPLETMHHFEIATDAELRMTRWELVDARPFVFG